MLEKGDNVTVYSEKGGKTVNVNLFWGIVTSMIDAKKGIYEITDKNEAHHRIERSDLRHRKRHSRAFGHVSDDKSHDRHAMQNFTNRELKELERYMNEHYPEDIPTGNFFWLHQHSDNVSQHFKSTGSLHFLPRSSMTEDGRQTRHTLHFWGSGSWQRLLRWHWRKMEGQD